MTQSGIITTRQLYGMLFISRFVGTFTFLFGREDVQPWELPFFALFYGLFSVVSAVPILLVSGENSLFFRQSHPAAKIQKTVYFLYGLAFLWAAGIASARLGLFTDTVLLQSIRRTVFVPFLLVCAAFCASKKAEALARASLPVLVVLLLTLGAILFSLTDEFDSVNLRLPAEIRLGGTLEECIHAAARNWETVSLPFLFRQTKGRKRLGFFVWISSVCACMTVIFVVLGGVTGEYGCRQMFPMHLLTATAKFGYLARFDDLLTGIWVLCALIKTAYLLYVCGICFTGAFAVKKPKTEYAVYGISAVAVFLLCSCISSDAQRLTGLLHSWVIPGIYMIFCLIIPIFVLLYEKSHRKKGVLS